MADRIKGITVQIGGDTTGLSKALSGVNKEIKSTQSQLKDVERLLKLDPTNTELLRQKQQLLGNAVSETKTKLDGLKDAEKQVQEQFEKGEVSQEQYNALQREIVQTENELKNLEKQANSSSVAVAKISDTADKVSKATDSLAQKTKGLSIAAAGVLTGAAASSVGFEDAFAKVSTLLDSERTDYNAYKQAIIDGSNETGIAARDYAEAVYSAISAGVDQSKAIAFVASQAKLAKGGFTDMAKAVDVTTTAINGYKLKAGDADAIADKLITTQNLGKTTVDELASSMGQVIPVASSANYSFNELSASYALLTKNGIATSQAGTYMKSMLSELTKSGSITDTTLRELTGKGFADLKAEGKSTSAILNMLSAEAKKNGKTLKDMFGSVEAGSAALVMSTNSGKDFDDMLSAMKNSAGAAGNAFETVTNTTGEKVKKSLNEAKNTAIELGDKLAPVIDKVTACIQAVCEWLGKLDDKQMGTIATVLMIIAAVSPLLSVISKVTGAIGGISQALSFLAANPVVLIIAGIAALAAAIVALIENWDEVSEAAKDCWNGICRWFEGAAEWFDENVIKPIVSFFKGLWESVSGFFVNLWNDITGVFSTAAEWFNANVIQPMVTFFRTIWESVSGFFINLWNDIVSGFHTVIDPWIEIIRRAAALIYNEIILPVKQFFENLWDDIVNIFACAATWFDQTVITPVVKFFKGVWESVSGFFENLWDDITGIFVQAATWWTDNVTDPIKNKFAEIWDSVKNGAKAAWEGIKSVFSGIADWFKNVFSTAWQKVKDVFSTGGKIFSGIKDGIVDAFKSVVNTIIKGINTVIAIPFNAINAMLEKIRGISILGVTPFSWIGTLGVPQIPMLAKGGVLSSGSAIVGEAGPELLTVMGNKAVVQPLTSQTSNTTNMGGVNIVIYGAPGQDVNELADIVMDRMGTVYGMKGATFA